MLVQMIRPRLVLELGTYSGYSALCLAEGLEEGARLYTFEVNDEQEDFTRPWLEHSPWADRIDFRIGDALPTTPCGTATCSTRHPARPTSRHGASRPSTTWWRGTRAWRK